MTFGTSITGRSVFDLRILGETVFQVLRAHGISEPGPSHPDEVSGRVIP